MKSVKLWGALVVLGLIGVALPTAGLAQAPNLGTAADFGVLAGSTATNTGPSVVNGDVGVSPGTAITGFPPGIVTAPGTIHSADAVAGQAQVDLTIGYNSLGLRPTTSDLTGQNLGGQTLVPGVYNFASTAQLTGALTLNAQGNPNAVFIFNIGSTLTTASNSTVMVIGGGQGTNVFWRVGSSATLGSDTAFVGDVLALTSITLVNGASISCGSALAQNGAVTLDTNRISIGKLAPCTTALLPVSPTVPPGTIPVVVPPGTTVPPGSTPVIIPPGTPVPPGAIPVVLPPGTIVPPGSVAVVLPPGMAAPAGAIPAAVAVANPISTAINIGYIDAVGAGATVPQAFVNLATLSPGAQAQAITQLSGEAGTGAPMAGIQAMNSFLTLVTNPFLDNRDFGPQVPPTPDHPTYHKGPLLPESAAAEPRRWSVWGASFGSQSYVGGNAAAGTHDRSATAFGFATAIDYQVTSDTLIGVALAGGGTSFGLADHLGGGRSDMVQSAVYSLTRVGSFYISTAIAYAWHGVSTDRALSGVDGEHLTADFSANNVGGRAEAGYRFAIPSPYSLWGFGVTPYGAAQAQAFRTPSYRERTAFGPASFALAYAAHTTDATRTELGLWLDWPLALDNGAILALRTRTAWAHDDWQNTRINASFQSLPGSSFVVLGAEPASEFLLASASAALSFTNGVSVAGTFDSEFARHSQTYSAKAELRYTW